MLYSKSILVSGYVDKTCERQYSTISDNNVISVGTSIGVKSKKIMRDPSLN